MLSTSLHQSNSLEHVRHQQAIDNEARCILALHCHFAHHFAPLLHGIECGIRGLRNAYNLGDKKKVN